MMRNGKTTIALIVAAVSALAAVGGVMLTRRVQTATLQNQHDDDVQDGAQFRQKVEDHLRTAEPIMQQYHEWRAIIATDLTKIKADVEHLNAETDLLRRGQEENNRLLLEILSRLPGRSAGTSGRTGSQ